MAIDYRGLQYGQQYFPNEEVVDETVTNINRPLPDYYTQQFGKQAFPHTGFNMPAAATNQYIQRKEDTEPGVLRNLWEGTKNIAGKFSPVGIINTLTGRKGATESFGGYPGSGYGSRAGLFPQEVQNLQALADRGLLRSGAKDAFGTNVVSLKGDYNKAMEKNLGVFKDTMAKKGFTTLDELQDYYNQNYGDRSYILNKLKHVRGWTNQGTAADKINRDPTGIDLTTITDKINVPAATTTGGPTYGSTDTSGWSSPGYTTRGGFTGTRGSPQGARGTSTPASGRGHHSWAHGGRIGYQDGELVEDESMFAATPRGMMEENIEEVQGEPTREQLEVIALEIFRLPLEELNEEQLNVVYQAAMEQEPAEEEVQFAAQEGPGEGIASLV